MAKALKGLHLFGNEPGAQPAPKLIAVEAANVDHIGSKEARRLISRLNQDPTHPRGIPIVGPGMRIPSAPQPLSAMPACDPVNAPWATQAVTYDEGMPRVVLAFCSRASIWLPGFSFSNSSSGFTGSDLKTYQGPGSFL